MKKHPISLVFAILVCGISAVFAAQAVSAEVYVINEVMSGLDSPRGLAFGPDGGLYVAEAGRGGAVPTMIIIEGQPRFFGASGAVSRLLNGVQERVVTGLPSLALEGGASATGLHDIAFNDSGEAFAVLGLGTGPTGRASLGSEGASLGHLVRVPLTGGSVQPIADLAAYEASSNPDGAEINNNPYGLLLAPDDGFAVTDAGGNDVLGVTSAGAVSTLSVLPPRPNPLPFGPPVFQAVPTAIAVGPDDAYYIGQLTGFPFPPGAANVYRFDPASLALTVAHTGFTNIIDLTFDGDGNLYVLQITSNGLASMMGPGPGALFRIDATTGDRALIASEGLLFPTSVLAGADGTLYVSNRGTSAGGGQVLSLTPVPEPSSMALLSIGCVALMLTAARRRATFPTSKTQRASASLSADAWNHGCPSFDYADRPSYTHVVRLPGPTCKSMSDVTHILSAIEQGDPQAAEQLLPLVYHELRKLAAQRLAQEKPGQTLEATALVHDAYVRLVDVKKVQHWDSRGHFFAAAAEAMRRILVEGARHKRTQKAGGGWHRLELADVEPSSKSSNPDVLALNEALEKLEAADPRKAALVKLRYFAGLTNEQAARVLGVSTSTADNDWAYAKSWLRLEMRPNASRD